MKTSGPLRRDVFSGTIEPKRFVVMTSDELKSEDKRKADEALEKENMSKAMTAQEEKAISTTYVFPFPYLSFALTSGPARGLAAEQAKAYQRPHTPPSHISLPLYMEGKRRFGVWGLLCVLCTYPSSHGTYPKHHAICKPFHTQPFANLF